MTDPIIWARALDLFSAIVDQSPEVRAEELAALRRTDPETCAVVESLLEADQMPDPPPHAAVAQILLFLKDEWERPEHLPDPLLGAQLDDYRLMSLLGRGGMGSVYLAETIAFERKVAIKILFRFTFAPATGAV